MQKFIILCSHRWNKGKEEHVTLKKNVSHLRCTFIEGLLVGQGWTIDDDANIVTIDSHLPSLLLLQG